MLMVVILFFLILFWLSRLTVCDPVARTVIYLYLGWWSTCLIISTFDLFSIFPVSNFTYALLLLNVAMFSVGYIFTGLGDRPASLKRNYNLLFYSFQTNLVGNRKMTLALMGLAIYLFRYFLKYQTMLAVYGVSEARNMRFYAGILFSGTLEILVYNYFVEAIAILLLVIFAYLLIIGSIRNWVFFWTLVNLYLYIGIGAGRTTIVELGVFIVILSLLRSQILPKDSQLKAKTQPLLQSFIPKRKHLILFLVLPLCLMILISIYLTASRMKSIESLPELLPLAGREFLDQAQSYSTGPFRALDYAVHHPELYGFHYGRLTLGGIDEMVGYPLRVMGFDYPMINASIGEILQKPIYIGSDEFNALYTCIFRYYFDFGILGVVGFSFLLGAFLRWSIGLFNSFPAISTLSIFLLLFGVSFLSSQNWHLAGPAPILFLVLSYCFSRMERSRFLCRWRPQAKDKDPMS